MSTKTKVLKIRPLEGYGGVSDANIVVRATAALTGLTGNSNFTALPVDLAAFKTAIDTLSGLISEAMDGSKKVIAQRNKQREVVIRNLEMLGRYVQITSNGDAAVFTSSGFEAASTTKTPPGPLPLPVIKRVVHGAISGEIVVQVQPVPKAKSYEIRYGVLANGAPPTSWTSKPVTATRPPVGFQGLTPGTVYAFQVRAQGKLGFTDWTDSTTCMCV
jgi:hypothetical protein